MYKAGLASLPIARDLFCRWIAEAKAEAEAIKVHVNVKA
jgi:hypothetical protein